MSRVTIGTGIKTLNGSSFTDESEVVANESAACVTQGLRQLRAIWQEIGIPEDQRLKRTEVVKSYVKDLLAQMVAEEEGLRDRLLKSIALCRREMAALCQELQLGPFQEEEEATILQLEKDLRTHVEAMRKQKRERRQELSALPCRSETRRIQSIEMNPPSIMDMDPDPCQKK